MKKLITYFSVLTISMMLITGCTKNNNGAMIGIYLKSTNGSDIIITENNEPICMSNESDDADIFKTLKSGDKIEVTFDFISETYPGGTNIYSCKLIEQGDLSNIPQDVLSSLEEMGWSFDLTN